MYDLSAPLKHSGNVWMQPLWFPFLMLFWSHEADPPSVLFYYFVRVKHPTRIAKSNARAPGQVFPTKGHCFLITSGQGLQSLEVCGETWAVILPVINHAGGRIMDFTCYTC